MSTRTIISLLFLFTSLCTYAQLESKMNKAGKFGFMNETEEWVIEPIYDEVLEFGDLPNTFAKFKGKWGIIDSLGKIIQPFEYSKINNQDYGYSIAHLYTVEKNKRYGLVNLLTATPLTEFVYENNFYFDYGLNEESGLVAIVYKNKKAGMLNEKGIEIIPCVYDKEENPFNYLDGNFYLVKQKGKVGIISNTGNQILPCLYDKIELSNSFEERFDVERKGKHGLCDFKGKELIAPIYSQPLYFEGEYAIAKLNGKYGIINLKGETIKPFTYGEQSDAFDELLKLYEN